MRRFSNLEHPLKRDGTSQEDRLLEALDPSKIKVDDRTDQDILAFVFQYASQVSYYDENLGRDDWTTFFQQSVPVQLALISRFSVEKVRADFNGLVSKFDTIPGFSRLFPLLDFIFDQAIQVLKWHRSLRQDYTGFTQTLNNLITNDLSLALQSLIGIGNALKVKCYLIEPKIRLFREKDRTTAIWGLSMGDFSQTSSFVTSLKGSKENKIDQIKQLLVDLFQVFAKAFELIVKKADEEFPKSIDGKDDHEPHLSLFYTFLKLFQSSKDSLNQLTKRHLDFFFEKALQFKKKPARPDQAYLVFDVGPDQESQIIPQNAQFSAGQDNNDAEILFATTAELIATPIKVESLKTLFVDRHLEPSKDECKSTKAEESCNILGVYQADVANSPDGIGNASFDNPDQANWVTLGCKESQLPDLDASENGGFLNHPFAQLGIVLASPVLLLREGKRCIEIELTLNKNICACLQEENQQAQIEELLTNLFKVSLSGESGWVVVPKKQFNESEGEDGDNTISSPAEFFVENCTGEFETGDDSEQSDIVININLEPSIEPITFPDPEALGVDLNTIYPLVRIELDQEHLGQEFNYCCLLDEKLKIKSACINTWVCGVRNLVLHNDIGPLDINQPFQPFGFQPKMGSSFYIGSQEIFCKCWTQLKLNYEWDTPPEEIEQIYKAYIEPSLDEGSFNISPTVLQGMNWIPFKDMEPDLALFVDAFEDSGAGLVQLGFNKCLADTGTEDLNQNSNVINRDFFSDNLVTPDPLKIIQEITEFSKIDTKDGFLQLVLQDSFLVEKYQEVAVRQAQAVAAFTFGDFVTGALYGTVDLEGNIDVAVPYDGSTALPADYVPLTPSPPYIPILKNFSIDYAAKAKPDSIEFIQIHPFGHAIAYPIKEEGPHTFDVNLLPPIQNDGNLYIGLSNVQPGSSISLLFQMAESTTDPFLPNADVEWAYLKNNQFEQLEQDIGVLSDTTLGLVKSGIVKFQIPSAPFGVNSLLPPELFWLRATVCRGSKAVANTINVLTNAVVAEFQISEENDLSRLNSPLPAMAIGQALQNLTGIQGFGQPYPSFGGRIPELDKAYYVRTSEYLRHKGRAITIFDYERLVLEAFPEIFKAKCISHTLGRNVGQESKDLEYSPGFVTLAVIPRLGDNAQIANILEPRVSSGKLLEIQALFAGKNFTLRLFAGVKPRL